MSNFINEKYIVNFNVPKVLQESIDMAEKADKENDYGTYAVYADNIDILAKNCCADGSLTKDMWDTLAKRFAL